MDTGTIHSVITNLRNPTDCRERVHFTSRSMVLLTNLFRDRHIDAIELHCLLLRIAYITGCFRKQGEGDYFEKRYISLRDIVTFLAMHMPPGITIHDILSCAREFDLRRDNQYSEIKDMYAILSSFS